MWALRGIHVTKALWMTPGCTVVSWAYRIQSQSSIHSALSYNLRNFSDRPHEKLPTDENLADGKSMFVRWRGWLFIWRWDFEGSRSSFHFKCSLLKKGLGVDNFETFGKEEVGLWFPMLALSLPHVFLMKDRVWKNHKWMEVEISSNVKFLKLYPRGKKSGKLGQRMSL